jgi:CDP-diacylglycerol pyrophosphatase
MDKYCVALCLMLSTAAVGAEDFDGSKPMTCAAIQGHDCLPTQKMCNELKPEAGKGLELNFDVVKKTVRTPYRYDLLPIQSTTNNAKSLVLQGTNLEFAWSATIQRTTGRFTLSIADREGAYVIFGQCKVGAAKPSAP